MKKILYTITVLVLFCGVTMAQENITNKFYFRYSTSTPTKAYYKYGEWSDSSTYRKGGAIEIGSILYFKNLDLGSKSKLGMDITYLSVSRHNLGYNLSFEFMDQTIEFNPRLLFYNVGSKLGPIFTYNVWDKMNVDVFAKVNPIWVNGAIYDFQDENPLTYYKGFMAFKYSFGMNVRYDFIMLGAELNLGKLKYQSVDDKDVYLGEFPLLPETDVTNSPCFNFTMGFCF